MRGLLEYSQMAMREKNRKIKRPGPPRPSNPMRSVEWINLIANAAIMDKYCWSEERICDHLQVSVSLFRQWKSSGFRLA